MMALRFLLVAPAALIALTLFGLYFTFRNSSYAEGVFKYPVALVVGLPMVITNVIWNVLYASFIFLELPPFLNDKGQFSPFFTTRIKKYKADGRSDPMIEWFIWAVNSFDPDHFKV